MPISPFRAKPKGSRWRSALVCQLLTSALGGAVTEPGHAQPALPNGGNAASAGVAAVPGGTPDASANVLRGFMFTAGLDASETAASNGRGTPRGISTGSGKRGPDEITQLQLNLGLHDHTARFSGDLTYQLAGSAFVHNTNLDRLSHNLTASSQTILVPEHLTLQARAFARLMDINVLGALGASDRPVDNGPNSGQRQVFGYDLSPDFKFRMADFATSDTKITQDGVFFDKQHGQSVSNIVPGQDIPNSTTSYGATETISSGTDFTRLNWSLDATGRKTQRKLGEISEASAIAHLNIAVSHEFSIIDSLGYESITSVQKLNHDLRGVLAMGGFDYSPSPDFKLTAQAGRQFNFPSYIGSLDYKISPRTSLSGSLTDGVTTPAQRLLDSLNSLGTNDQGQFVDTNLGNSNGDNFDPAPIDGIGITNNISRFRSAHLSLSYDDDRMHYRLTGFGTKRDRLTAATAGAEPPRTEVIGTTFSISRQITPLINSNVALTYSIHNVLGGRTNIARGTFEMTYDLREKSHIYMRAAYLQRLSSTALVAVSPLSGTINDVTATIGFRQEF